MGLKLEHVSYLYGTDTELLVRALDDVNLEIPDGQFIGLIGHTGSGKSTLVQHLNGLLKPSEGTILFNGENIWAQDYSRKTLRSKVGLVFQYPEHQLFETDVFADVCYGPKNLGLEQGEIERRAKKALELVGFPEKFFGQSPFELSGGQKRRVAIAGVLAMEPDILVLDEPTAGLDVGAREGMLDILRAYMEEKPERSILISSHISSDLEHLCDDIYVIHKGKIVLHEEMDTILEKYAVLKVSEEQYRAMDKSYLLKEKKEVFGIACLTNEKQYYMENYPEIVVESGSLDQVILMLTGGERG